MAAGLLAISAYTPARDRQGRLVPGARMDVFQNRTTTRATVYADAALTTPLTNPVVANASGQFPAVWADGGAPDTPLLYSLAYSASDGSSIGNPATFDDIQPSVSLDLISGETKANLDGGNVEPAPFRDALDLGQAATRDVGTIAGTVAAGDDLRITTAVTNVFRYIPVNLWGGIFAGTNTTDLAPYFQQAINGNSVEIFIPGWTFLLNSTINIERPIVLRGAGKSFTLLKTTANIRVFNIESITTYGMRFQDLTIWGNGGISGSSTAVYIGSEPELTAHARFDNVRFLSHEWGINGLGTYGLFDSQFDNCDWFDCYRGMRHAGSQITFNGCYWRNCTWGLLCDNLGAGLSISGGTFNGCTWVGNTYDFVFNNNTVRQMTFMGCWFEQTKTISFGKVVTGEMFFQGMSFLNCLFQPASTAVENGVIQSSDWKGILSFRDCKGYTDLYTSTSFPDPATADSNSFVTRQNCYTINAAGTITKLAA